VRYASRSATTCRVELQRLDHVSINVRDRAASIAWYRDTLGLAQRNEPTEDSEPVFMGAFGACIALFQSEVESPRRAQESSGVRHIAFALSADGLEQARGLLTDAGVAFRPEDHGSALSIYLPDPDGNMIELTTYLR
jgi:catechol 2,3-dioxygenase-like lactoylglutathione lyase family enzyme